MDPRNTGGANFVATMLGLTGPYTVFQGIAVAPFFIWELVIGLWMTFKGFNRDAVASLYGPSAAVDATNVPGGATSRSAR